MRVIVVRHYKTLINVSNQIMGWGDSPRAKDWQADLAFVDRILRKHHLNFDAIYTSHLERSRQTGIYYAEKRQISLLHNAPELNEINYGSLFRKNKKWVENNFPRHKKDPDFVYPKGESFRQMQKRSVKFLLSLGKRHKSETILVVIHAGVIRGMVSNLLQLPYEENLKRKISHRYIGEFLIEGKRCVGYNELGKASGFVAKDGISIPWKLNSDAH
ncbi:MAG: histidine phosphatase family protein [Sedimenticola sp.]